MVYVQRKGVRVYVYMCMWCMFMCFMCMCVCMYMFMCMFFCMYVHVYVYKLSSPDDRQSFCDHEFDYWESKTVLDGQVHKTAKSVLNLFL